MNVEWLRLLQQFEPLVLYHRGGHSEGGQLREMKRNRNKIDSDALEKFQLPIIHPHVNFFFQLITVRENPRTVIEQTPYNK